MHYRKHNKFNQLHKKGGKVILKMKFNVLILTSQRFTGNQIAKLNATDGQRLAETEVIKACRKLYDSY